MATREQENYIAWLEYVHGMDFIQMQGRANGLKGEYKRFTTNFKEIMESIFNHRANEINNRAMRNNADYMASALSEGATAPENWWDIALKVGNGKKVENNPLSKLINSRDNWACNGVYETLVPVYQAIKENFDKRIKIFSWLFDHARYTAERDTLNAISGLVKSMTGDDPSVFAGKLQAYKEKLDLPADIVETTRKRVDEKRRAHKALKKAQKSTKKANASEKEEEQLVRNLVSEQNANDVKIASDAKESSNAIVNKPDELNSNNNAHEKMFISESEVDVQGEIKQGQIQQSTNEQVEKNKIV